MLKWFLLLLAVIAYIYRYEIVCGNGKTVDVKILEKYVDKYTDTKTLIVKSDSKVFEVILTDTYCACVDAQLAWDDMLTNGDYTVVLMGNDSKITKKIITKYKRK